MSTRIRLLICDDHELVRRGLRSLLESDPAIDVAGEAGNSTECLERVGLVKPDIVIMDVRMPGGSGIEACREIRERHPGVRVLMLTSFADDEALFSAIMAGASGYVLKRIKGNDLIDALHKVHRGESLLDPAVTERVLSRLRGQTKFGLDTLSSQEQKIIDLIAEGLSNRQIGEEMHLAEKTVKNYVSTILAKLGFSRRTEVIAFVARQKDTDDSTWVEDD